MSISIIKDNYIYYPIGVYYNYNLYLITEYNKFLKCFINSEYHNLQGNIFINENIDKLKETLEINISNKIEHIFDVMDWENILIEKYKILDEIYKSTEKFGFNNIKNMNFFLRQEKLKKLNEK
jgi:hypothetical protein